MNGFAARIAKKASEIKPRESDLRGCFWAEQIPRYYRRETDSGMNLRIRKHLEECEECNVLLTALAVQPDERFRWVERGARWAFDCIVNLGEFATGESLFATAMRGNRDDYSLIGKKIVLPDNGELYINIVANGKEQTLTATTSDKRRFDLYSLGGGILKSMDNVRQIRIDMSDKDIVLIIDDRFEIDLGHINKAP